MGTHQEGSGTPSRRTGDPKQPSVLVVGEAPLGWNEQLAADFHLAAVAAYEDVIAFAESHHPDAIVVCGTADDNAMLLSVLSRSTETMATPVVLISHDLDPDDRALALESGACDLISDRSNARELAAGSRPRSVPASDSAISDSAPIATRPPVCPSEVGSWSVWKAR